MASALVLGWDIQDGNMMLSIEDYALAFVTSTTQRHI